MQPKRRHNDSLEDLSGESDYPELSPFLMACTLILIPFAIYCLIDNSNADDIDPEYFSVETIFFTGAMQPNSILRNVQPHHKHTLNGASSFVHLQGHLYVATVDGLIWDIEGTFIRCLSSIGPINCTNYHQNDDYSDGSLSLRESVNGNLIVLHSYLGIYQICISTGENTRLLPPDHVVGGKTCYHMNDFDISSDGHLYITDTSTKWYPRDEMSFMLENRPSGRIFSYDPVSNKTELLLSDRYGPNGLQISKDGSYFLFVETPRCKIMKYHLTGDRAGALEHFSTLPGLADNIRLSSSGGYWVSMSVGMDPDRMRWYSYFGMFPRIRRAFSRLLGTNRDRVTSYHFFRASYGLVVEYDVEGQVQRSFHDPEGTNVKAVTEVLDLNNRLILGTDSLLPLFELEVNSSCQSVSPETLFDLFGGI